MWGSDRFGFIFTASFSLFAHFERRIKNKLSYSIRPVELGEAILQLNCEVLIPGSLVAIVHKPCLINDSLL